MGAWGPRSFENDNALDWLGELAGIRSVRTTLTRALKAKGYLDVDDACAAIAAAEVVAAARGHAEKGAPPEIVEWVGLSGDRITPADATLATKAIARVQKDSELQQLWADGGKKNPWTGEVTKLLKRLAAKPIKRAKTSARKPAPAKRTTPDDVPTMVVVNNPDKKLQAAITSVQGMCLVYIDAGSGGGSVFFGKCDFAAMSVRWINKNTLEVTYPAKATLDEDPEVSWFYRGRTVAIRYVRT
ncbi:MAG TPA: DUF4259 domain-containing protein [Kofleriaceae bacterium]|jgi:hypothetical protein